MSKRLSTENCGTMTTTNTTSATMATAVIANMTRSASPTPQRWMPMKIA